MRKRIQHKGLLALVIGFVFSICLPSVTGFAQDIEEIRGSVLRLHILANSDSEEDQALKLAVRDRILELDYSLFDSAHSVPEAKAAAEAQLEQIEAEAKEEIRRQGYDYPVRAEVGKMYFPTREYEGFTLPAGEYEALRLTIGSGEGKNWWCVLYPPLCLPAAESGETLDSILTPEQRELVEGGEKIQVKFAAVEWIESLRNWLQKDG